MLKLVLTDLKLVLTNLGIGTYRFSEPGLWNSETAAASAATGLANAEGGRAARMPGTAGYGARHRRGKLSNSP